MTAAREALDLMPALLAVVKAAQTVHSRMNQVHVDHEDRESWDMAFQMMTDALLPFAGRQG